MKKITKEARTIETKRGERLLIDLSWIKTAIFAHNRYCLLIMDEYTHFLCSYFLKSKDEQVQVIVTHLIHITNDEKVKVESSDVTIQGKIMTYRIKSKTNIQNWIVNLISQHLIHRNKMVKLKESLLPNMVG
jgi:hypothetical protein